MEYSQLTRPVCCGRSMINKETGINKEGVLWRRRKTRRRKTIWLRQSRRQQRRAWRDASPLHVKGALGVLECERRWREWLPVCHSDARSKVKPSWRSSRSSSTAFWSTTSTSILFFFYSSLNRAPEPRTFSLEKKKNAAVVFDGEALVTHFLSRLPLSSSSSSVVSFLFIAPLVCLFVFLLLVDVRRLITLSCVCTMCGICFYVWPLVRVGGFVALCWHGDSHTHRVFHNEAWYSVKLQLSKGFFSGVCSFILIEPLRVIEDLF